MGGPPPPCTSGGLSGVLILSFLVLFRILISVIEKVITPNLKHEPNFLFLLLSNSSSASTKVQFESRVLSFRGQK